MVDSLWPANAVAGAPSYNGRMLRQTGSVGLAGATTARPLGARSGVRPGTPASTASATSTTWTLQPFAGVADVMTASESGPYSFAFDASATGAVTAAHATLPRKDILYVSITDPAESVGATPTVVRKYLAGTANASPVAPAIPGTERGFVVAELSVPASGGGSPTVTWVAPYSAGAGGVIPFNTRAQLDAVVLPAGTYGDVFADPVGVNNGTYRSTGAKWVKVNGGVSLRTTSAQTTAATSYTAKAVTWNVEDFDTDGYHDNSANTSQMVAPAAGLYRVSAKLKTTSTAFASGVQLGVNGVADAASRVINSEEPSAGAYATVTRTYSLNAGDYVEVFSLGEASNLQITIAECFAEMQRVG